MVYIQKQINVVNRQSSALESTYKKRARQLVKNERAVWISNDTICLTRQSQEETIVELSKTEIHASSVAENGRKLTAETSAFEDKIVLDLAKRRLAAKRNLTGQVIDFFLLGFCLFILIFIYEAETRFFVSLVFCTFWSIRLFIRIIRFAKPSFKDGISAYFQERRERKIESEYNRLKKMSAEYVASELNK